MMAARNQQKMLSVMNSITCAACGKAIDIMALADHDCEANRLAAPAPPAKQSTTTQSDPAVQQGNDASSLKKPLPTLSAPGFLRWGKSAPVPKIDPDVANRAYEVPPELSASEYSDYSRGARSSVPVTPSTQITSPGSTWSRGQPKHSRTPSPPSATISNQAPLSPLFAAPEPPAEEKAPSKGFFGEGLLKRMNTKLGGTAPRPLPKSPLRETTESVVPTLAGKPKFRNEAGREHFRMHSRDVTSEPNNNSPNPPRQKEKMNDVDRFLSDMANFQPFAGATEYASQQNDSNPYAEVSRQPLENNAAEVNTVLSREPIQDQPTPFDSQPSDRKPFLQSPFESRLPNLEREPTPLHTRSKTLPQEDPIPFLMRSQTLPQGDTTPSLMRNQTLPQEDPTPSLMRSKTLPQSSSPPRPKAGGFLTVDPAVQMGIAEIPHRRARSNPSQDMRTKPLMFPEAAGVPDYPLQHERKPSYSTSGQSSLTSSPVRRGGSMRERRVQEDLSSRDSSMPKQSCRGCAMPITGRSLKDVSGRLTGRYHRECFQCVACNAGFPVGEFYVLDNKPLCKRDYHERNRSTCNGCKVGIEGRYVATDGRLMFHDGCFRCAGCNVTLREEYWEVDGKPMCQRHAFDGGLNEERRGGAGGRPRESPRKRQTRYGVMNNGSGGGSRSRFGSMDRLPPISSGSNGMF